jgi:hypothetical protein
VDGGGHIFLIILAIIHTGLGEGRGGEGRGRGPLIMQLASLGQRGRGLGAGVHCIALLLGVCLGSAPIRGGKGAHRGNVVACLGQKGTGTVDRRCQSWRKASDAHASAARAGTLCWERLLEHRMQ